MSRVTLRRLLQVASTAIAVTGILLLVTGVVSRESNRLEANSSAAQFRTIEDCGGPPDEPQFKLGPMHYDYVQAGYDTPAEAFLRFKPSNLLLSFSDFHSERITSKFLQLTYGPIDSPTAIVDLVHGEFMNGKSGWYVYGQEFCSQHLVQAPGSGSPEELEPPGGSE